MARGGGGKARHCCAACGSLFYCPLRDRPGLAGSLPSNPPAAPFSRSFSLATLQQFPSLPPSALSDCTRLARGRSGWGWEGGREEKETPRFAAGRAGGGGNRGRSPFSPAFSPPPLFAMPSFGHFHLPSAHLLGGGGGRLGRSCLCARFVP